MRKTASASQVRVKGPSDSAVSSMPLFHTDRAGSQATLPASGLARSMSVSEFTLKAFLPRSSSPGIVVPSVSLPQPLAGSGNAPGVGTERRQKPVERVDEVVGGHAVDHELPALLLVNQARFLQDRQVLGN